MFKHLLLESDSLLHRRAPVPGQQLELDGDGIGFVLRQSEAVDGGAMDGGEVGVVGLGAGIGGEPILLGSVRSANASLSPEGLSSATASPP